MKKTLILFLFYIQLNNCLYIQAQNEKDLYIDRFDKATFQSLKVAKWNSYSDSAHRGGTQTKLFYTKDPQAKSQVIHLSYSLLKKDWEYQPYAGISCSLMPNVLPKGTIEGIAYEYKGNKHGFNYLTSSVQDHCYFKKQVPESKEWTTVIIPFSELKQEYWGLQIPFNYFDLTGLTWVTSGNNLDSGSIFIDNIRFIRKKNTSDSDSNFINDSVHFSKPDSSIRKIFTPSNDSLFNNLKEYKEKSDSYYTSLQKIEDAETRIDSIIRLFPFSSLSNNEKGSLKTLLLLSINKVRGDVSWKVLEHGFHWKKKFDKFISFDTLCRIDQEYQKNLSAFLVANAWASNLWDFASFYKTPKAKDTSHVKEINSFHFKPNDVIAEVGAGSGYFEQNLSKFCNNITVYVNEIDSNLVSKLDIKLHFLDRYDDKNIQYIAVLGNEKSSHLPDSIFDKIIIKNTFHHFSFPKEMLDDFKRALKKNGHIFIVDILMDEIEKPACPLYMKRVEFMNYFIDNGFVLLNEVPLSYHNKCFEFQLIP